jgi:transcription termination factor Rho
LPEHRFGDSGGFSHRISSNYSPAYNPSRNVTPEPFSPAPVQEQGVITPTLEELLSSGNYEEGSGILELHPDGYGFLRAPSFLPSTKDIYVSMAQIRRFGLRTGDYIEGKIRPQREGDKYSALLYISTINGVSEEEAFSRPAFDELTPVYPDRRISLESPDDHSLPDMRLIDLIAPIGFGQRGLILCPPDTGKTELMKNLARVICRNYPDAQVLMLLIDVTPEDATMMRESVPCQVLSSSFDQAPEAHLRLSEIVLERSMRLVEQKKDVVLLVDSLTRLAKIYTTAAVQQGRSLPGMINPASLFRAKRMFGAARSCKEGGSLTVIAAMDISTGSKVDDSVVEEFKGTANMELTLDLTVARAGVRPALNLQNSFTKNADILLNDRQKEGLSLIRTMLGTTSSAVAIPQLLSMMDKADTNADLLLKMKDWFALMNR